MDAVTQVRMSGPLTCYVEGFAAELRSSGYTELSLANQLRLMSDLSRWLAAGQIPVAKIDHSVVARFLAKRRRTHTQFVSPRAIAPLLGYLRVLGAIRLASAPQPVRREALRAYERYLVEEREVAPARRAMCLSVAEEFLGRKRVADLTSADVTQFIDDQAPRSCLSDRLSALRSVLRFLFLSSKCPANLVYAVPSSPHWTQRSLPQALEIHEFDAVLAICDRRTLVGCRDYAVLLLLGRLGLRAGEVAVLQLDAIDWRTGELTIHGKGRSLNRLPLPADAGQAMAGYLQRAVRSKATRSVFVRCRAPYTSLAPSGITAIAHRALRAAGIERGGSHRLRHTAATQMLRQGASMTEIAQVLRHRHVNTTAIYAKVDTGALCTLAPAWPVDAPDPGLVRELVQPWPRGVA